jgi:hypothetical protein
MSSSVDTRVVEMQFDNASFQKGVAGTMASLEQLSDKLDSGCIGSSGLDKLKAAIQGVNFDSIGSGLDGLLSKASSVFSGITGFVGTLSKTVAGVSGLAVLGGGIGAIVQAITGGSQRATNIENARFMIKGLGKDFETLSDDINYAVDGTAYGFDAAANAAAQFSASGIEAGDDMKKALRGISGVAAMTASDYESISHIFTAVAGQGKLMTIQMRQLELRGMNAAATLAKYLDTTEENVREMVTEGKIDFATFSAAMDDAFGEHAKEANETFTGAVANMKAALNKIGADFFTPIHEMERQTALGFRLFFNSIREGLKDTPWDLAEKRINDGLKKLSPDASLSKLFDAFPMLERGKTTVQSFSDNMTELGSNIYSGFEKLYNSGTIQTLVYGFTSINDALFHGFNVNISALFSAFIDKLTQVDLSGFIAGAKDLGKILTEFADMSASQMPYVVEIFANLIQIAFNLGNALASFLGPLISNVVSAISDFFGIDLGEGASFLETLAAWTDRLVEITGNLGKLDFSSFSAFIDSVKEVFLGGSASEGTFAGSMVDRIKSFSDSLTGLAPSTGAGVVVLMDKLSTTFERLGNSANHFLGDAASKITDFFKSLTSAKSDPKEAAESIIDGFGFNDLLPLLSMAITGLVAGIGSKLVFSLSRVFTTIADSTESIVSLPKQLEKITNAVSGSLTRLGKAINKFATAELIKSVAMSIGILAASLWLLSTIDPEDLVKAGVALAAIAVGLGVLTFAIGAMAKSFTKGMSVKDIAAFSATLVGIGIAVTAMAGAILILTAAVALLGMLDTNRLVAGVAAVAALLVALGLAVRLSTSIKTNPVALVGVAVAVLALAAAMVPIVAAVAALSFIPFANLIQGLSSFLVLLGAVLLALGVAATSLEGSEIAKANGFAAAIGLLAAAMIPIVAEVAALSFIPWENLVVGLGSFAVLLTSVSLALGLASHALTGGEIVEANAFAIAIGLLGAAMIPIVAAVAALGALPMENVIFGLGTYVLLLSTVSVVLGLAATTLEGLDIAKAAGFAVSVQMLGAAMLPIAAAIAMLGALPVNNIVVGLVSVVTALGAVTAVGVVASKFIEPTTVLTLMGIGGLLTSLGTALYSIANAAAILSALPSEGLGQAVDALMQMVAAFTVMSVISALVSTDIDFLGLTASLTAFGVSLAVIASAIVMLAGLPVDGVQQAAIAFTVLVAAFAALTAVIGLIPNADIAVLSLGGSIALLGVGLIATAAGVFLFVAALATLASLGPEAATRIGDAFIVMAQKLAEAMVAFSSTLKEHSSEIASATGETGIAAAEGFATAAPAFANAGVQAIVAFAAGIGQEAGALASAGLLVIENFLLGFASGVGKVIDAGSQLVIMTISGIGDTIRNNASMLGDAVGNLVNSLLSVLGNMLADGIENLLGPNPVSDAIRGWSDNAAAAAEDCSQRVNDAFEKKNAELLVKQDSTMSKMADITSSGGGKVADAGEKSAQSMFDGISGVLDLLPEEQRGSVQESLNAISGLTGNAQGVGLDIGYAESDGVISGIDEKSGEIESAAQAAIDGANNVDTDGYGVGSNFGSGVYSGIDSWIGSVCSKAAEMVRQAKASANSEQDAQSPSRDMMKSGGWFAQGFMIGIQKNTDGVVLAAASMVAQAKEPVEGIALAMSSMMDGIDWDAQPVITPVLDTSQIEDGLSLMDGLFPQTQILSAAMLGRMQPAMAFASGPTGDNYDININLNYDATDDATALARGVARNLNAIMDMRG